MLSGYEDFTGYENTKFSEVVSKIKRHFRRRPGPSDPRALKEVFMIMATNQTMENQQKLIRYL